jgi:hypothetical protein
MGRRTLLTWLAAVGQLAVFLLFLGWTVWEGPVPLIRVRWSPNLAPEVRAELERELGLHKPEPTDPDTFQYELWSAQPQDIAALVQHPQVDDTAGIDRKRFRLDPEEAGLAPGRVWRGGLAFGGPEGARRFRVVFGAATGVTLLLTAFAAVANRRTPQ